MTEELPKAPSHPSVDVRSLVLHAGHGSGIRVAELERRIVGSIAVPLRHAARIRTDHRRAEGRARGGVTTAVVSKPTRAW